MRLLSSDFLNALIVCVRADQDVLGVNFFFQISNFTLQVCGSTSFVTQLIKQEQKGNWFFIASNCLNVQILMNIS